MTSIFSRVQQWFSGEEKKGRPQTENRKKHELRRSVIAAFGEYIERDPPVGEIRDVEALPYPKEQILEAIYLEIALCEDESEADAMMAGAQMLAEFQEGVGERPITQLGSDFSAQAGRAHSMSQAELLAFAASIADNPDTDRYEQLRASADAELIQIRTKLVAADAMRRAMPPEKKRSLRN